MTKINIFKYVATQCNGDATRRVLSEGECCSVTACDCCVLSGVRTGRCITSDDNPPHKSCEIYAWCPVENDTLPLYAIVCYLQIILL